MGAGFLFKKMIFHILEDALTSSILITGLVLVMMMLLECLNIESHGSVFKALSSSRLGGILTGAVLGVIPGCMGGFATVSLYTHRMISFGALVAMMIASAGDEAFFMLAMIPRQSLWIFALLFVIAIGGGFLADAIAGRKAPHTHCEEHYAVHPQDEHHHRNGRHASWQRIVMFLGVAGFIAALASGVLDHGDDDEKWMHIIFAAVSLIILVVLVTGSDHFVHEHFWNHIIKGHLFSIFAWTFGTLLVLGLALEYLNIESWISSNTALMVLLAAAVGIIPESGPHMVFVSLYASGIVPLPVLLASCISQDGHASLPLLAESKESFIKAKIINCVIAIAVGFVAMLF